MATGLFGTRPPLRQVWSLFASFLVQRFGNDDSLIVLRVAGAEKECERAMLLLKLFQFSERIFFLFQLCLICFLEDGPLQRVMVKGLAQCVARRNVFHPQI